MSAKKSTKYVSRGGDKLAHALSLFSLNPKNKICVDLGCSTGGFTEVLLQAGATKVYAVDTAYGVLEWKLRKDDRVIVMERTNALHVELPEKCEVAVIDAGWTRQDKIIPVALKLLHPAGEIVSLIKPHYEVDKKEMSGGLFPESKHGPVLEKILSYYLEIGVSVVSGPIASPIKGSKGGNLEYLVHLRKAEIE
jgi:23S rRNA (cytidine1920-2'-O)/16S rRNA (cytidine1409-2'-O)-methyltransferase